MSTTQRPSVPRVWEEIWLKEDWWAVWLGLALVVATYAFFSSGSSLIDHIVTPGAWSDWDELLAQMRANAGRYALQYVVMLAVFAIPGIAMGYRPRDFIPGFSILYALSVMVLALAASDTAMRFAVDTPLIALVVGLLVSNLCRLPRAFAAGFRVEFYIKTGIVLLGATLPINLIVWAGPIAILQASIASVVTFLVIYKVARFLEIERTLAAMLAAGGAVCGVSAVIAVAGAVRARRDELPVAMTLVVFWAIVMIALLPLLARAWFLPTGVAGAWIGTSEFADAAGFAAAETYGGFARSGFVAGSPQQALWAYTLVKVVGRDLWIGIWAFVLSLIAVTRWRDDPTDSVDPAEIWWRFPKFILGFIVASLLVTLVTRNASFSQFNDVLRPEFLAPLGAMRGWAFTFSFLSIGLSTRITDLHWRNGNAFLAFSTGVVVNLVLGFVLSAVVFESYWSNLQVTP